MGVALQASGDSAAGKCGCIAELCIRIELMPRTFQLIIRLQQFQDHGLPGELHSALSFAGQS